MVNARGEAGFFENDLHPVALGLGGVDAGARPAHVDERLSYLDSEHRKLVSEVTRMDSSAHSNSIKEAMEKRKKSSVVATSISVEAIADAKALPIRCDCLKLLRPQKTCGCF